MPEKSATSEAWVLPDQRQTWDTLQRKWMVKIFSSHLGVNHFSFFCWIGSAGAAAFGSTSWVIWSQRWRLNFPIKQYESMHTFWTSVGKLMPRVICLCHIMAALFFPYFRNGNGSLSLFQLHYPPTLFHKNQKTVLILSRLTPPKQRRKWMVLDSFYFFKSYQMLLI